MFAVVEACAALVIVHIVSSVLTRGGRGNAAPPASAPVVGAGRGRGRGGNAAAPASTSAPSGVVGSGSGRGAVTAPTGPPSGTNVPNTGTAVNAGASGSNVPPAGVGNVPPGTSITDSIVLTRQDWDVMRSQLAALQAQVANFQHLASSPASTSTGQATRSQDEELKALRAKLTAPKAFAGMDRQSATDFINECKRFFRAGKFTDPAVQVALVSSWLSGVASQWFTRTAEVIGDSFETFEAEFLAFFEHKQRARNARAKLDVIRQQPGRLYEYDAYVKEFAKLVGECEQLTPDPYTLRVSFMRGLSAQLRQSIVNFSADLNTWEEVRDACYSIDTRMGEASLKRAVDPAPSNSANPTVIPSKKLKADKSTKPGGAPKPAGTFVPALPQTQHLALKTAKLCWRCGGEGHQKHACAKSVSDAIASRTAALKKLGF